MECQKGRKRKSVMGRKRKSSVKYRRRKDHLLECHRKKREGHFLEFDEGE
jgi:hypothetical protein